MEKPITHRPQTPLSKPWKNPGRDEFHHSQAWTRISKRYRNEHPICEANWKCTKEIPGIGHCVDHKIPRSMFNDYTIAEAEADSNLQTLCDQCHHFKTRMEQLGRWDFDNNCPKGGV